jgi:elongation factor G
VVPASVGSATRNIGVRELIHMIVRHVPSPAEIGSRTTADGKTIDRDPAGPFVAQVFKVTADPFVGRLTYFRVCRHAEGTGPLHNANRRDDERFGNILAPRWTGDMLQAAPGTSCRRQADLDTPATPWSRIARRPCSSALASRAHPQVAVEPGPRPISKARPGAEPIVEESRACGPREKGRPNDPDRHGRHPRRRHRRAVEVWFGAAVKTGTPRVPYRETIRRPIKVDNRFKRQTRATASSDTS